MGWKRPALDALQTQAEFKWNGIYWKKQKQKLFARVVSETTTEHRLIEKETEINNGNK